MRAAIIHKAGGVETLELTHIEEPKASANEVLVTVKSIGINPVDYKVRMIEDVLTMICGEGYPAIIGWDIAGVVKSVGAEVSKFKAGDKVFGMVNFPGRGNAYAEVVASPEDHLALMPENASFEEAAATTLAALTALQALQQNVKNDDRVLIHAGSGGVGHFAIQIAKYLGAYVITTSSSKNKEFVTSLGADEHIDYREHKFEDVASDIDFVLDGLGEEVLANSIKVMKSGGTIISLPSPPSDELLAEAKDKNVNVAFLLVESNGDDMNTLKTHLENGTIKPHISSRFSFDDIAQSHVQLESGRTVGKVVVNM